MSYNFDDHSEDEQNENVTAVLDALDDDEIDDDQLEEDVETRLEAAVYLKSLLKGDLFMGDNSAAARIVTRLVRDFVRTKIKHLLGMEQEKIAEAAAPFPFSPEEVAALKMIVTKVIHRPQMSSEPQLRTVERTTLPTAPTVVSRQVSEPPLRQPKPEAPKAPKAKPKATPPAPAAKKQPRKAKVLEEATTEKGERIVKTQKENGRIVREYFDASGTKTGEQDLTPQVRPPGVSSGPQGEAAYHLAFAQATAATQGGSGPNIAQTMALEALRG